MLVSLNLTVSSFGEKIRGDTAAVLSRLVSHLLCVQILDLSDDDAGPTNHLS